jgi:DNA replication initiation complex subunit (GINS family)
LYEEIFEAWKREKNSEVIQPLPPEFLEKASRYLTDLKLPTVKEGRENNPDPTRKRETEYTEFMLSSLLRMRARKIALSSLEDSLATPANLVEKEKSLLDDLRTDLAKYMHWSMQLPIKEGVNSSGNSEKRSNTVTEAEESSSTMLLRILQPIPRLVGVDLQEYGPFQQEDLVVLPKENALVLIARGVASEVRLARIQ